MSNARISKHVGLSVIGASVLGVLLSASPNDARVADAAMAGDREVVKSLLKQGADVNAAQGDGTTPLHWAARRGDVELAQMLIYAGANVRATTRLGGWTPLLMAAQLGHPKMIETLLNAGSDLKTTTAFGATPLMLASAAGNPEAVRLLLSKGGDVNAAESVRGETALMFASAYNRFEAMRLLIDAGADVKRQSKVFDLKSPTNSNPDEEAFLRAQQDGLGQGGRGGRGQGGSYGAAETPAEAERGSGGGGQRAATPGARAARGSAPAGPQAPPPTAARPADVAGGTRQFRFAELVSAQGGMSPLLFAARQGHVQAAQLLLSRGADVNQISASDATSPLLIAIINGHFDLAKVLLDAGADPRLASDNGVTPLYAVLNVQWAPKALYPQPRAYTQQKLTHIDMMKLLLDKGVDVNARLHRKVWYSGYNFDLSGVDEIGATPFWRAAYASDIEAMRLLVAHGADPNIPTMKPAGRPRTGDGGRETVDDVSTQAPVPVGGPGVTPLQAASGVGFGEGYAANSHRNAPTGWMPAVKYLVEDLGADVNAQDHEGNTALHHAAARGDNEMILYLVSKGADVMAVNRAGETTVDMANGPVQRIQPFPETIALLEKMGAKNNNRCKSC
jgi:ankyrin repeat protein